MQATLARVRADLEQAQAAVERVRALHQRVTDGPTCGYCARKQRFGYHTDAPCDTIRALDGTEQPTTTKES